jgi:poly-gamma-glutamate synthesis protein (capsule biosynthesis protein)
MRIFLAGDVMTGRGIDQALATPSEPSLHEPYVRDARVYLELAERANGPIARPLTATALWGDALATLERLEPAARIVNLETSVTTADAPWPRKSIHYRMHPANVGCLAAAKLDCCVLANNHVVDWGFDGLEETLVTLAAAGISTAGAGRNSTEAESPSIIELRSGARLLVYGCGSVTSGIPIEWGAELQHAGVALLAAPTATAARRLSARITRARRPGDIVIVSVHWGANWGYEIDAWQRDLAHELIDAGVDVVHGHSSHHAQGIEVYRNRAIIYGCGDFINDYEGIAGHEQYRGDLSLGYFLDLEAGSGRLLELRIAPFQMRRFGLHAVERGDAQWVRSMLEREGARFGTSARLHDDGTLLLGWN